MTVLVTGAAGFVGANLVRHLLSRGDDPVALIRPGGDPWRLLDLADELEIRELDLVDPAAIDRAVRESRPDVVYHLAAHGAYSWQRDLDAMLAVNVRATEALLSAARAVDAALVHAGTSSEYGYRNHAPAETERLEPNSHYAVTKAAATHLCGLAAATGEQHVVTLRLYSVYGAWEDPDRLMPTLMRSVLAGGWPPLAAPETARDFVWAPDVCDAFVRAGDPAVAPTGAVFNVASGVQTTLRELTEIVGRDFAIGREPSWGSLPSRRWDTAIWIGDPTEAARVLGWRARTPLDDGLRQLGEWLSARPDRRSATSR